MPYPLPALPRGRVVFLDANIFVYGLLGESEQCLALMERCRNEEVAGVTSTEVVGEACHRLMVKEAVDEGLISRNLTFLVLRSLLMEYLVDRSRITRPPIHPGVIFADIVMPELRKTRTIGEIATVLRVSRQTLHRVMAGEIAISPSPDMGARLGKLCGNGAGLWLRMQANFDAWEATHRLSKELSKIPTLTE